MKSYDYNAVVFDGEIYCLSCLPENVNKDDYDPIFADSEWQSPPVCYECHEIHSYIQMLPFEPQSFFKIKNGFKTNYILNSNGNIQLKSDNGELKNVASLYWKDGELQLKILSQIKKERFKKTLESEESTFSLRSGSALRIKDLTDYLGEETYE